MLRNEEKAAEATRHLLRRFSLLCDFVRCQDPFRGFSQWPLVFHLFFRPSFCMTFVKKIACRYSRRVPDDLLPRGVVVRCSLIVKVPSLELRSNTTRTITTVLASEKLTSDERVAIASSFECTKWDMLLIRSFLALRKYQSRLSTRSSKHSIPRKQQKCTGLSLCDCHS